VHDSVPIESRILAMLHLNIDQSIAIVRTEISKYYDKEFNNNDNLYIDLSISSDDLSAIALSIERKYGIKFERDEYKNINNVEEWARIIQNKVSKLPEV
jgi:acyl carrier protein